MRSYLLVALKHFLANERHYASAIKRNHGQQPISLDEILAHQRNELEPAETLTAEQIYERRWALLHLCRTPPRACESRIFLGIHWSFDKTEGIHQGRNVADHVFSRVFRPLRKI